MSPFESRASYMVPLDVADSMSNTATWTSLAGIDPNSLHGCDRLGTVKARKTCHADFPAFPRRQKGHWQPASPGVTGYDSLMPPWEQVSKRFPMAYDAVSSPDKNLLVVFTSAGIQFYSLEDLATPRAEFPQWSQMAVLTAQWATGSYVNKWQNDLADVSTKMRAVNTALEPKREEKFRRVETRLVSEIESGQPPVPFSSWLHDTFPGRQFFWDFGPCATHYEYKSDCTNVQFSLQDGRSVRISFDAGPIKASNPPVFVAGFVELGRMWFVEFRTLAEMPKALANKFHFP